MTDKGPVIAIIDYGMGNLFSVAQACTHAGIETLVTSSPDAVDAADAVILPGVGAFGDAMATLRRLGLDAAIHRAVDRGRWLMGICLGMQMLCSESDEFGSHEGLGLIQGKVRRFAAPREGGRALKVPQVGWNAVHPARDWRGTALVGVAPGEHFYFVHSYCVHPDDPGHTLAETAYGDARFTSAVLSGRVFGCQFHPERSGPAGLRVYDTFKSLVMGQEIS